MWRRLSSQLRVLRSVKRSNGITTTSPSPANLRSSVAFISRHISSATGNVSKTRVEDIMPIATGHEREELQAEIEGRDILDINFPEGPFGTKASATIVHWKYCYFAYRHENVLVSVSNSDGLFSCVYDIKSLKDFISSKASFFYAREQLL